MTLDLGNVRGAQGAQGKQGNQGIQGEIGPRGEQGIGLPSGGSIGQILVKASPADYDTGWISLSNVIDKTVALNFSTWDNGTFTETLGDNTVISYTVVFDENSRPVSITSSLGDTCTITW